MRDGELCHCCGIALLLSGSRFSCWFCEDCLERVREVHGKYRAYLLPIGRHSSQSGFGLTAQDSRNARHVSAFMGKARTMGDAINHLSAWASEVVQHNLNALGIPIGQPVPVRSYCDLGANRLNKGAAFGGLCRHFGIGDSSVITIAR